MFPDDILNPQDSPMLGQGLFDVPNTAGLFQVPTKQPPKKRGFLGRVWKGLKNYMAPIPSELAAEFSEDDIDKMQSAAIHSRDPQESLRSQMAAVMSLRQLKQQEAARAQMQETLARFRSAPNETPQQAAMRMQELFQDLVSMGQTELAGKVGEVLKSQADLLSPQKQAAVNQQEVDLGDRVLLRDPVTGQERIIPKGAVPRVDSSAERAGRMMTAINPETGLPELAEVLPNGQFRFTGVMPGSARESAATEGERKAGVLLTLTQEAIDYLDNATSPGRLAQFAGQRGLNEFLTADRQRINQAGFLVADAYVRLTSGANAPEPEVERAFRAITPQPGDTPELLAQKSATRKRFVAALKLAAGRAGSRVPGQAPTMNNPHAPRKNPLLP
jgi:hypothetical protein